MKSLIFYDKILNSISAVEGEKTTVISPESEKCQISAQLALKSTVSFDLKHYICQTTS